MEINFTEIEREHFRGHLESEIDCYDGTTDDDDQRIVQISRGILVKLGMPVPPPAPLRAPVEPRKLTPLEIAAEDRMRGARRAQMAARVIARPGDYGHESPPAWTEAYA